MLLIEAIRCEAARLPVLVRIGILGLAFAGFADVIAHLEAGDADHLHTRTASELSAHLAGFVSMVVVYVGVVADGVRKSRARRRSVGHQEKGVA